jgi:hypothetical protein
MVEATLVVASSAVVKGQSTTVVALVVDKVLAVLLAVGEPCSLKALSTFVPLPFAPYIPVLVLFFILFCFYVSPAVLSSPEICIFTVMALMVVELIVGKFG